MKAARREDEDSTAGAAVACGPSGWTGGSADIGGRSNGSRQDSPVRPAPGRAATALQRSCRIGGSLHREFAFTHSAGPERAAGTAHAYAPSRSRSRRPAPTVPAPCGCICCRPAGAGDPLGLPPDRTGRARARIFGTGDHPPGRHCRARRCGGKHRAGRGRRGCCQSATGGDAGAGEVGLRVRAATRSSVHSVAAALIAGSLSRGWRSRSRSGSARRRAACVRRPG